MEAVVNVRGMYALFETERNSIVKNQTKNKNRARLTFTSDSIGSFFGADRELVLDRVA